MHQPYYTNSEGEIILPWVFLHAVKDYYDMPFILSNYPLKATFNITPTLLNQLAVYSKDAKKHDRFIKLLLKQASALSESERKFIVKISKSAVFETMVKPLKGYLELFNKNNYTDSELENLQVWSLLSYCGIFLKNNSQIVKDLLKKDRFAYEDKLLLVDELVEFTNTIIPFYKKLFRQGTIELSTTPYTHPILPLLIDMNAAANLPVPKNHFSLIDDAKKQIFKAIEIFSNYFGEKPKGMWPAEGAVDKKTIKLFQDAGISWIATDQDLIDKNHYKSYSFEGLKIVFRDKGLSDAIGFVYKAIRPEDAVDDFIKRLSEIEKNFPGAEVFVILDGENAWEFYPNNGWDFLNMLYERLVGTSFIETTTISETNPEETLNEIKAGSWIYGNFSTWVGDPKKNRAWEMLFEAKQHYLNNKSRLNNDVCDKIDELFLKAEASDWFWWYGSGHHSEYEYDFDELFRENLINIYKLMDIEPPKALFIPITDTKDIEAFSTRPKFYLKPEIDGKITTFFEWLGSGFFDEAVSYSAMDTSIKPIKKIFYGMDKNFIYIRLDGDIEDLKRKAYLKILSPQLTKEISLPLNIAIFNKDVLLAAYEIIELALNKKLFNEDKVNLRIELSVDEKTIQILPGVGEIQLNIKDDFSHNWFV